jgi:hypothetical protein
MKLTTQIIGLLLISNLASAGSLKATVEQQVRADLAKKHAAEQYRQNTLNLSHGPGGTVTVGAAADADCDFNMGPTRIQDAIDSGAQQILVSNADTYFENLVLDDTTVVIRGGYSSCADANNGLVTSTPSVIDGSLAATPVVSITGNTVRNNITLVLISLENGTDSGLKANAADALIELLNVDIRNNSDNNGQGGAISIFANDTDLYAHNLFAEGNTALFGGAIGCQGFLASVTLTGTSTLFNNQAIGTGNGSSGSGGAVFLGQDCSFSMYSGGNNANPTLKDSPQQPQGLGGAALFGNQANRMGGAIHSINQSKVFLFGQQMCVDGECLGDDNTPLLVMSNSADDDAMGAEGGGAISLLHPGNEAILNGVRVENNSAGGPGGAFQVDDGASLVIYRDHQACWQDVFCNALFSNEAGTTVGLGGLVYNRNAQVDISNAFISENRADFGTVLYGTGEQSVTRIEGSILNENGNNGADGWSDNHVINVSLGASADLLHNTLADNRAEVAVFNVDPALDSSLNLQSSIVDDASSGDVLNGAAGPTTIHCLMAHENLSFAGTQVVVDDPEFVDPAMGDFSLDPLLSPAIDFCDDSQAVIQHPDINFETRGWDDPAFVNNQGAFDLGADESLVNDIIFADDFDD